MKKIAICVFIFCFNSGYAQSGTPTKKSATTSTKKSAQTKFKYDITYSKDAFIIDQLARGYTMGCWAYAATSMYEWKKQASYAVEDVIKLATYRSKNKINYSKYFSANSGLPLKHITDFTNSMDWTALNYSPNALILYELLISNGPLCFFHNPSPISTKASAHVLIFIGLKTNDFNNINNTFLEYLDPWYGKHSYMTFAEYSQKYTSLKGPDNYLFHNK